ncbi:rubrerythrin [Acidobacterium capsulatum ATCC 51196]|uniref:Rubrerythrin n=2 Tax=Acidobacteriaceae TaxID=204434 RepID=C1F6K9_ACIC5|nr:rubrerythrin [Acidobacterium capsulatum ATCC 51196]
MAASSHEHLHAATLKNLSTAMHGEAYAHAKYLLYAEAARKSGHAELADVFTRAAKTERTEHFAEEAALAGLAGSNAENLRDAIAGESYEAKTMYPSFAEEAAKAGDAKAAKLFREIAADEAHHRDAFQAELKKIDSHR